MRHIAVDRLEEGMKIARTIYNSEGNVLLSAGVRIRKSYIRRLMDIGIDAIYVHPDGMPELDIPEPISDKTRVEAVKAIKGVMDSIMIKGSPSFDRAKEVVGKILDEILVDDTKVIHLNDIRSIDNKVFYHSVNVSVLSILIALESGYNKVDMKKIALGALLHDIGLTMVDKEIVNKEGKLTPEEYEEFKKHPYYGYQIMRDIDELNVRVSHVVYQHHERLDGSGYPRGLKGDEIMDFAQIVGVANLYDVLSSEGLSGEEKMLAHQALKLMGSIKGVKINGAYVDALKKHVASYPIGSIVILNNGETGPCSRYEP